MRLKVGLGFAGVDVTAGNGGGGANVGTGVRVACCSVCDTGGLMMLAMTSPVGRRSYFILPFIVVLTAFRTIGCRFGVGVDVAAADEVTLGDGRQVRTD